MSLFKKTIYMDTVCSLANKNYVLSKIYMDTVCSLANQNYVSGKFT